MMSKGAAIATSSDHRPTAAPDLPLPLAAAALLVGVMLALYQPLLGIWNCVATGIAALVLAVLARTQSGWQRWMLLGAAILSAGLFYANLRVSHAIAPRLPDQEQAIELSLLARVEGLPRRDPDRISLLARTEQASGPLGAGSLLRLSWYRAGDDAPALMPGDCLQFQLRLRGVRGPVNDAGWDPERSALAGGWVARGSIRSASAADCEPRWSLDRLRYGLAERVDQQLSPGAERAALKALALGDTREFSDAQWDQLRRSGLSHLMAISGLHIGLVAGFGALLITLIYRTVPRLAERLPRIQAQALCALAFAVSYAALAGFSLPTQRALVGLGAFLAARLLRRAMGPWSAYALALVAVLLIDPIAPLSAGFWLSFGAAGWLLYLFARGGRARPAWRSLLLAQAILALGLWPITALWFQQGSLIGPGLNLIAVPWVSLLVVPLVLLGVAVLALLPALLAQPLLVLASGSLHPLWWLLERLDPYQLSTSTAAPGTIALLLALLATLWLFAPYGVRFRACALLLWLPLLWPRPPNIAAGAIKASILDVGQGQAIVVQTAHHSLLVDTGPGSPGGFDAGEALVVPNLRQLGVRELDGLILSHADSDHAGGRDSLLQAMGVGFQLARMPEPETAVTDCNAGDGWDWDGVAFSILHPPLHFPYLGNESSCVLRVEDAFGAVLLIPGDIGTVIEQRLVREQAAALPANVLISPHHGSAGSSSAAFLAAVAPQSVIHSAGWGNRFAMPRSETVARVAAVGAVQLSTARSGQITLLSDAAGGFVVDTARSRSPRSWRAPELGALGGESAVERP